jgi:hypothetical protein
MGESAIRWGRVGSNPRQPRVDKLAERGTNSGKVLDMLAFLGGLGRAQRGSAPAEPRDRFQLSR